MRVVHCFLTIKLISGDRLSFLPWNRNSNTVTDRPDRSWYIQVVDHRARETWATRRPENMILEEAEKVKNTSDTGSWTNWSKQETLIFDDASGFEPFTKIQLSVNEIGSDMTVIFGMYRLKHSYYIHVSYKNYITFFYNSNTKLGSRYRQHLSLVQ